MLVVEDGTIVSGANSYVSVTDADTYISSTYPNDTDWSALTTAEKEAFLKRSVRFLNTMMNWRSEIKDNYQALAFPRLEFKDNEGRIIKQDSIPQAIIDAQVELAYSLAQGEELTTEYEKIEREDFGDTSDSYAVPVARGGNELVRNLIKSLSYSGYGNSRATIVTVWRA